MIMNKSSTRADSSGAKADHKWGSRGRQEGAESGSASAFPGGGIRDSLKVLRQKKVDRIFIMENGKPKRVVVKSGLNGGGFVAVEGDLQPGQQVIVGTISRKGNAQNNQQLPFGGAPPGAGMRPR
jgi:multidrug efflux pump subunit AcrA (membrane-fusion protein)